MARDKCRDRHSGFCCHICNWEHPEDRLDKATLDEKIYTEGSEIVENGLSSGSWQYDGFSTVRGSLVSE